MSEWCARTGTIPGAILPLHTVWELAKLWYHDRLEATFRGRSMAEAQEIFRELGLTTPFWRLESPPETPDSA